MPATKELSVYIVSLVALRASRPCSRCGCDSVSLCLCLKQAARSGYKGTRQLSGSLNSLMRSAAWDSLRRCRAYRKVSRAMAVPVQSLDHQQFLMGPILFPAQLKSSLPDHKDSTSWHQVEKNLPSLLQASPSGIKVTVAFACSGVCTGLGPQWQGAVLTLHSAVCLPPCFLASPYPVQNETSWSLDRVALHHLFLLQCRLLPSALVCMR